jgi:hypothetical protein
MTSPSVVHKIYELLSNHCTARSAGRQLFVQKVNSVLTAATLDSRGDIDTAWRQTWDKPLYADQYAYIASDLIDRLRAMRPCPVSDFRQLPLAPELLIGLKRYTIKHARLLALGSAWPTIHARHVATSRAIETQLRLGRPMKEVSEFARRQMGAPGYADRDDKTSFFAALTAVRGFGQVTALHISTDLGYPVYKPDRWVLRFVALDPSVRAALEARLPAGIAIDQITQGYLGRHLELVLFATDHLTAEFQRWPQPKEIVDLGLKFRRHRFVDLMVVKFGMTRESQFGLEISGKDALLRDSTLAGRYPELLKIALDMDAVIKLKGFRRSAKSDDHTGGRQC